MRVSNFRPLPRKSVTANPCGRMAFHQLRSCPKIGSPWKLAGVIYSLLRSSGRMLTSFVTRPQGFGRSPHPSFKTMRWPNGTHILAARTGAADKESLAVYMTSESRLRHGGHPHSSIFPADFRAPATICRCNSGALLTPTAKGRKPLTPKSTRSCRTRGSESLSS